MRTFKAITVGLIALLLFSCPGSGNVASGPNAITVWALDNPTEKIPASAYAQALVENFKEQNPDFTINWLHQSMTQQELDTKLSAAVNKNEGPDIVQSTGAYNINLFAGSDKLIDLTAELSDIAGTELAKEIMTFDEKIFGVTPFFSVAGVFINEGKFKELGLNIPNTLVEMESAADALKAAGVQPFACDASDITSISYLYMYLVNRLGSDTFMQSIERQVRFDDNIYLQAGEIFKRWAVKGFFGAVPLTGAAGEAVKMMSAGSAGMHVAGSGLNKIYADTSVTSATIGFYPFPTIPGGKGLPNEILGKVEIGFIAFNTAQSKKDIIVKFMQAALAEENIKMESTRISSIPNVQNPERLADMTRQLFYNAKSFHFIWDQIIFYTLIEEMNKWLNSMLLSETDIKKACTSFEQQAQQVMGGVRVF